MISRMFLGVLFAVAASTAAAGKMETPHEARGCPVSFESGPWTGHGGTGNDAISAMGHGNAVSDGRGNDAISNTGTPAGGFGNDGVSSTGYGNKVRGGTGRDNISGSGASNTVHGSQGWDNVSSLSHGNYAQGPRTTDWTYKKPAASGLGWQMDFISGESCCYARSGSGAACPGR